jgi:hypothetical protein
MVTASLNVLLSSSSLVTAVTMSSRRASVVARWPFPGAGSGSAWAVPLFPGGLWRGRPGMTVAASSGGSPGRLIPVTARVTAVGPPGASIRHPACRGSPVRTTAASCVCTAARCGGSTKTVSCLPVA